MCRVGNVPTKKEELRKSYHKCFDGLNVILILEDVISIKQALSLLPKVYDQKTRITILMTSRTSLNMDNYTKNDVHVIQNEDIVEKKKGDEEDELETDSDVGSEDEKEEEEESDDDEGEEAIEVDGDAEVEEKKIKRRDLELEKESNEIFGESSAKKTVSIEDDEDDEDDDLNGLSYPKRVRDSSGFPYF
jgi:hypothetical protein